MDVNEWILLSLVFYSCIAAATAWHAFLVKRSSVFEPIGHYILFLTLFTLPLPIRASVTMEIEGNVTPYLPDIVGYLPAAVAMSAISIPIFAIGYFSRTAAALARCFPAPPETAHEHPFLAAIILGGLGCVLLSLLAREAGGLLSLLLLGYNSSAAMVGQGHLAIGFPIAFTAALMLLYAYARKPSRVRLLFLLSGLAAVLFMQVMTGNRAQLLYSSLVLATFYHFAIRRIGWRLMLALTLAGFLSLNFVGIARNSDYSSVSEFLQSTHRAAEVVQEEGAHSLFYTLTTGEFIVPFETLPQMLRVVGGREQLWLGLSYARAPLFLIPSALFPLRPLALSNWYMQQFYDDGEALNEGRQFFFLAEAYLNFSVVGVVALALLWGVFWGALQRWIELSKAGLGAVLIHAVLVGYMFRCIAGDSVTLIAGVTQQALAPVIVGLLILTGFKRWRSHRAGNWPEAQQALARS